LVGLADERFDDQQPFFPPVSTRRELGGVPGGRGDLVREVRSSGPRTVVDDWGDADPTQFEHGWDANDGREESGRGE